MLQQEQFVYLIRLIKEEYTQPHIMAFISKDVCDEYFDRDLKYYRKRGWEVDDNKNYCADHTIRRAYIMKKEGDKYEKMTLVMESYEITKK